MDTATDRSEDLCGRRQAIARGAIWTTTARYRTGSMSCGDQQQRLSRWLASPAAHARDQAVPDEHEIWKPVGCLGTFEVSSFGRVRWVDSGKLKPLTLARSGFLVVNLYVQGISSVRNVHSVVAEAFLGPRPAGWMVVQIDKDRLNNHWDNLGYRNLGERQAKSPSIQPGTNGRIDLSQAREILRRANLGAATIDLADQFDISAPMVSVIKSGGKWRVAGHNPDRVDV